MSWSESRRQTAALLERAQPARGRRARRSFADSPHVFTVLVGSSMLFLAVFVGYPIFYNLIMSFQSVSLGNMRYLSRPFIGLGNYTAIFENPLFREVSYHTLVFTGFSVLFQCGLGLALALYFHIDFRGARWMRGVVLCGWVIPPLVVGAIFHWLFASNGGFVNQVLRMLHIVSEPVNFLSSLDTAMPVAILTNVWIGAPFAMILFAAGRAELPGELYEAAQLDGANPVQRFLQITWPLMRPTIYAVVSLCTIYALKTFDVIWGLTSGGPVNQTTTYTIWSYKLSFTQFAFGQGSAISTLMFVFIIVIALIYSKSLRAEVQL